MMKSVYKATTNTSSKKDNFSRASSMIGNSHLGNEQSKLFGVEGGVDFVTSKNE